MIAGSCTPISRQADRRIFELLPTFWAVRPLTDIGWSVRLISAPMQSLWSLINTRALSVSVAHDAFSFEISWFGILLIVGAMLLWRHLRR